MTGLHGEMVCTDDAGMRTFDQMIMNGADANVRTVYYLTV